MFTLLSRSYNRIFPAKMIESSVLFNTAIAVGCGIGLGWVFRGCFRSATPSSVTDSEVGTGTMGDNDACKLILVVRTDLQMGKGKIAAQCCHAAVMAYEQLYKRHPQLLEEWRHHGQPKVVLKTDSEESLMQMVNHARSLGLVVSLVHDAGRTQIAAGTKTTIGIGPGPKEKIDSVTGHLKLL